MSNERSIQSYDNSRNTCDPLYRLVKRAPDELGKPHNYPDFLSIPNMVLRARVICASYIAKLLRDLNGKHTFTYDFFRQK